MAGHSKTRKLNNGNIEKAIADAKAAGLDGNKLFAKLLASLDVYGDLVNTCKKLQQDIDNEGIRVSRTFANGNAAVEINPAVDIRNQTVRNMNETANTLINIIVALSAVAGKEGPGLEPEEEKDDDL